MKYLFALFLSFALWALPVTIFAQTAQPPVTPPTSVAKSYQVLGAVNRPSTYYFPEQGNVTLLDALNAANGQAPRADVRKAHLIRTVDGKQTDIKVDLVSLQKKGSASANIPIQPDDILVIPSRGRTISDVLSPLALLDLLGFRLGP